MAYKIIAPHTFSYWVFLKKLIKFMPRLSETLSNFLPEKLKIIVVYTVQIILNVRLHTDVKSQLLDINNHLAFQNSPICKSKVKIVI